MTEDPPAGPAGDATVSSCATWYRLEAVLLAAAATLGPGAVDLWLDEARLLELDGRAAVPDLVALAARGAFGAWSTLRDCATGTAAHVTAVLEGWERDGVPGTGRTASGAGAVGGGPWDGEFPNGRVEVGAVWCAAAAHRLGLEPWHARAWARAGLLRPDRPPEPGWAADPQDGPDAEPAPLPEHDEVYRELRRWVRRVGAHDAPACFRAGLDPAGAQSVLELPAHCPERSFLLVLAETLYGP